MNIEGGFAPIPNWMIRESELSAHALLVFAALASHQGRGGIYPSRATLAAEARCSVRKVAEALNELEEAGVVARTRRTSKQGQASSGYELHFGGRLGADEEVEASGASTDREVGAGGARGEGTSEQVTLLIEEEPLKKNPHTPTELDEAFEDFWKIYPRKTAKKAARAAFLKAVKSAGGMTLPILAGARRFAEDPNLPELQFVPMPTTWLNQGRWEDGPLPARGSSRPSAVDAGIGLVEQLEREAGLAGGGIAAGFSAPLGLPEARRA